MANKVLYRGQLCVVFVVPLVGVLVLAQSPHRALPILPPAVPTCTPALGQLHALRLHQALPLLDTQVFAR